MINIACYQILYGIFSIFVLMFLMLSQVTYVKQNIYNPVLSVGICSFNDLLHMKTRCMGLMGYVPMMNITVDP